MHIRSPGLRYYVTSVPCPSRLHPASPPSHGRTNQFSRNRTPTEFNLPHSPASSIYTYCSPRNFTSSLREDSIEKSPRRSKHLQRETCQPPPPPPTTDRHNLPDSPASVAHKPTPLTPNPSLCRNRACPFLPRPRGPPNSSSPSCSSHVSHPHTHPLDKMPRYAGEEEEASHPTPQQRITHNQQQQQPPGISPPITPLRVVRFSLACVRPRA